MASGPNFYDSEARLVWVQRLATQIKALATQVQAETNRRGLELDHVEDDGWRYVRIRLPDVSIPEELGFLIADLAVNARSCLDMAMDELAYWGGSKWVNPQFPIRDPEPAHPTNSYERAMKHLQPAYAKAVQEVQPRAVEGWDIPLYRTATVIRELSNENKHRNLTPVLAGSWGHGFMDTPEIHGKNVTMLSASHGEGTLWPADPRAVFTMRAASSDVSLAAMLSAQPNVSHYLRVQMDPHGRRPTRDALYPIGFGVQDLQKLPEYVDLVIRNLKHAARWVATDGEDLDRLVFDWDADL